MKEIRLKSLTLENFRCHSHLHLDFDGRDRTIYGDNASGKTSIYDSLTWLLFGKDCQGGSAMEVQPLGPDGEVRDPLAVTVVTGVLTVDGEERVFRRTYHTVQTGREGGGHTSEFFVDGVPCRKNQYQQKVGELVEEDTFRMLTALHRFAGELPWQKRRAILFEMMGLQDEDSLLSMTPQFADLDRSRGRLSLEDFERKLRLDKRNLTAAGNDLPARISELEAVVEHMGHPDFDALKARKESLAEEQQSLQRGENPREELEAQLEKAQAEYRLLKRENGQALSILQEREDDLRAALLKLRLEERKLTEARDSGEKMEELQEKLQKEQGACFTEIRCPCCGQTLEGQALQKAETEFLRRKEEKILVVQEKIDTLERQQRNREQRLLCLAREQKTLQEKREALTLRIKQEQAQRLRKEGLLLKFVEAVRARLEGEDPRTDSGRKEAEIAKELEQIQGMLSMQPMVESTEKRLSELRRDAELTKKKLTRLEQLLSQIGEFTRYKIQFLEEGINGQFRLARFRLYRRQVDGSLEPRCDVTYGGVPYGDLNTGAKINVGMDIISTLSRHYGVTVPLFADNSESVTAMEKPMGQLIRLKVSEGDPVLRME